MAGRFIGGALVDGGRRRGVAVAAAVVLTVGVAGYALAGSVGAAAMAAVLVGLGGVLFGVPVMAHLADLGGAPSATAS